MTSFRYYDEDGGGPRIHECKTAWFVRRWADRQVLIGRMTPETRGQFEDMAVAMEDEES